MHGVEPACERRGGGWLGPGDLLCLEWDLVPGWASLPWNCLWGNLPKSLESGSDSPSQWDLDLKQLVAL